MGVELKHMLYFYCCRKYLNENILSNYNFSSLFFRKGVVLSLIYFKKMFDSLQIIFLNVFDGIN